MTARWEDVAIIDERAIGAANSFTIAGRHYFELGENGWFALVGWCAGTNHMIRVLDTLPRLTRVSCDGDTFAEPRTAHDQEVIEDDVEDHLSAIGAPPRPPGFRWFLELPPGYQTSFELMHALDTAISALEPGDGWLGRVGERLPTILAELYESDIGQSASA